MGNRYEELKRLCLRNGVAFVVAFGSRAGSAKRIIEGEIQAPEPESELKIAVAFEEFFPEENRLREEELLRGFRKIFRTFRIRLVYLEEQRGPIQWEMFRGARLFCRDEEFERRLKRRVLERFGDWYEWWGS